MSLGVGQGLEATQLLASVALSDLALATLEKEKGKPELSLNSLWGAGLTGLTLARESILQIFFPYGEIFRLRRHAFPLTSKTAGDSP